MSQQTNDLRLRRTQTLLREALIELIEEQSFDKITVRELTERAMVSRAAFYRNYQDKYDLVEQIFDEAMQELFNAVSEGETQHPPQGWVRFFEHIATYERLYGALLGRKGSPWFVLKMRAVLLDFLNRSELFAMWKTEGDVTSATSDDFVPNLVVTMFVEAITWWLENEMPYSPQEMVQRCASLFTGIAQESNTWNA